MIQHACESVDLGLQANSLVSLSSVPDWRGTQHSNEDEDEVKDTELIGKLASIYNLSLCTTRSLTGIMKMQLMTT